MPIPAIQEVIVKIQRTATSRINGIGGDARDVQQIAVIRGHAPIVVSVIATMAILAQTALMPFYQGI